MISHRNFLKNVFLIYILSKQKIPLLAQKVVTPIPWGGGDISAFVLARAGHLIKFSIEMNSCSPRQLLPGNYLTDKRTAVTQTRRTAYYPVTLLPVHYR